MSDNESEPQRGRVVRSPLPLSLTDSTGFLLSWVAAHASQHFTESLAEVGLTAHQLGVLTLLTDGPMKQARLSEQLAVFQPVMVTLVNELEALGLVERRPHPNDRRALEVHLLPVGRDRLRIAGTAMARSNEKIFGALDASERAQLHDMLLRMSHDVTPTETEN